LEYDNVMNKQREIIYGQRRQTLEGASLKENILDIIDKVIDDMLTVFLAQNAAGKEDDIVGLVSNLKLKFGLELDGARIKDQDRRGIKEELYQLAVNACEEKEKSLGPDLMRHLERMVFLQIIDSKWKDHLYAMDYLREGIGLRAYGQRDPLVEYKREAFEMFSTMISSIEEEAVETIFKLQAAKPERFRGVFSSLSQELSHPEVNKPQGPPEKQMEEETGDTPAMAAQRPVQMSHPKVGRNDPCPCGSGKKYKKCCGK